jgi:Holliday junction DNA helicase RuvA
VIGQLSGTLVTKELDHLEVMTSGGVGYVVQVPLGVHDSLPKRGENVSLYTHLVVKEDGWQLFGFATIFERRVFQRVLGAKGIGPSLALGMLSALTAERLVRAIRDKDIATLQSVPRMGRKKAEQLILDLADKVDDITPAVAASTGRPGGAGAEDAVRALASLGYSPADAERAVRAALDAGGAGLSAPDLIRSALAKVPSR